MDETWQIQPSGYVSDRLLSSWEIFSLFFKFTRENLDERTRETMRTQRQKHPRLFKELYAFTLNYVYAACSTLEIKSVTTREGVTPHFLKEADVASMYHSTLNLVPCQILEDAGHLIKGLRHFPAVTLTQLKEQAEQARLNAERCQLDFVNCDSPHAVDDLSLDKLSEIRGKHFQAIRATVHGAAYAHLINYLQGPCPEQSIFRGEGMVYSNWGQSPSLDLDEDDAEDEVGKEDYSGLHVNDVGLLEAIKRVARVDVWVEVQSYTEAAKRIISRYPQYRNPRTLSNRIGTYVTKVHEGSADIKDRLPILEDYLSKWPQALEKAREIR